MTSNTCSLILKMHPNELYRYFLESHRVDYTFDKIFLIKVKYYDKSRGPENIQLLVICN